MRTSIHKLIADPTVFKNQILRWSQSFREIIFLDNNSYPDPYSSYDCVLAIDAFTSIKTDHHNAFEDLKQYQQSTRDWIFGYLTYDLKNDLEDLKSTHFDGLAFPELYFFQPKKLFLLKENKLEICYLNLCDDEIDADFDQIISQNINSNFEVSNIEIKPRISKDLYIDKVSKILEHINRGDIYEANFCMEFYAENAVLNPLKKYFKLNEISLAPFSVYFKNNKHFLVSASPERYLKKLDENIISQPIKGTSKRFNDKLEDEKSKNQLLNDPKEISENIMITDLVRNDLSKTAQKGSVKVTELCKVYSFQQVHQMITTITSKLAPEFSALDVIKTTFPMGSMTGAPKISAMKIIEDFEETKRGLYSGSVGYFTPNSDFDFNVIIRSILYNQDENYLSFSVGSAITSLSIPDQEYAECLLKAKAMLEVLS